MELVLRGLLTDRGAKLVFDAQWLECVSLVITTSKARQSLRACDAIHQVAATLVSNQINVGTCAGRKQRRIHRFRIVKLTN